MSGLWSAAFRVQYRVLALIDPLVRRWWRRFGLGNIVELRVAGRHGSTTRSRMLGILHAGGTLYLGHPNGDVGWTRDLRAAGGGLLVRHGGPAVTVMAEPLARGSAEREAAIRATGQHPFPGNLVYRLGRRHVRRVGVYFRVTPVGEHDAQPG